MTSNEWLDKPVPFDLVRRGYAPEQVTAHIAKLEYDLHIAAANQEATSERLRELTSQLASAQAETEALRDQLDRDALAPLSMSNLSERAQRMMRLAEEESAETRIQADEYAAEVRCKAEEEAAALLAAAQTEAATLRASAKSDTEQQRADLAEAQEKFNRARNAFDGERTRAREQLADQIKQLMSEATFLSETTTREAIAEAERISAEAEAEADRLVAHARDEAARLAATAAEERERQEEDFELAIGAKRVEAHRAIAELEREAQAEAARLRGEAAEEAAQLTAQSSAEAQSRIAVAMEHANQIAARAAATAHRHVAHANAAADELFHMRADVHRKLRHLQSELSELDAGMRSQLDLIEETDAERQRPRAAEFTLEEWRPDFLADPDDPDVEMDAAADAVSGSSATAPTAVGADHPEANRTHSGPHTNAASSPRANGASAEPTPLSKRAS